MAASRAGRRASVAPISVLHVVAPGEAGGLESVVRLLAAGHRGRGHAVHVAAILEEEPSADSRPRDHPWLDSLRADGVDTTALQLPGRSYLKERATVADVCRRLRPTVVHTHGYRPDVIDAGAARSAGVPTVTTVHGFTGGGWKNRLYERIQVLAFRRFDAVVAVSRPLETALASAGVPRARLHMVPNAFDARRASDARDAARASLGVDGARFHVGWVGRLSREKGADVLVAALAELVRAAPDLPLAVSVLGDGRERAALEAQAATLGLCGRITWHGMVRDAGRLFPAFDAFVLSSRTEGTPIVLFEAMAAGVPVIAARVGGVPDVVSDREALLVPPDDPAALAAAIRAVAGDRAAAAERAGRARRRLDEHFGVGPWLARYEEIYRAVARPGEAPA